MNRRTYLLTSLMAILAISTLFAVPVSLFSSAVATGSIFSWNSRVGCTPLVVRITDITSNQTGPASFSSSPFTPGITTSATGGEAKRWLTSGPTPPGWVSPGPACTVTNSKGTTSLFVQINGVERSSLTNEDWSSIYDPANGGTVHSSLTGDTTFNLFDPAVVTDYPTSCTSSTDPTCYDRIHGEIDHDWKAAGYCGPGTFCDNATLASQTSPTSSMIDVQGFISWDPDNLNSTWHQFNGWEIHPLTAWKLSSAPPPVPFSISVSPAVPQVGQTVAFTATPTNGTVPSTFSWDFGDGVTTFGSSVFHMYVTAQAFTVHITMTDTQGNTFTTWKLVPVGSWNPAVDCAPVQTSLEGVIGNVTIQRDSTNTNSIGADYSGGGFKLDGNLPYGSNPTTWPFFKRDLQPPCSVNGTSSFAEFHNVTASGPNMGDCSTTYSTDNGGGSYPNGWQSCDTTFNLITPGFGDDSTPGAYMHRVYAVIDRDWNASSVTPLPPPTDGQRVDVQGFIFWNNDFVNATWHSYSGWEVHALTAWRPARPVVTASASFNLSNPTAGQTVTFTGAASGGAAPYSFTWDFGDGTAAAGNPVSHTYAPGTYPVHMAAADSQGTVGVFSQTITVTAAPDFSISASPSSLIVRVGKTNASTILLSSLNGFSGNVSVSSSVTPVGPTAFLSPTTVTLVPNGSGTTVLNVSASLTTPPGTYNVAVTGASGSLQKSVQVTVNIVGPPTFVLSANPAPLVILAGSKGKDNITATSIGGFSGTVQLTVSGAPSGVKLALNPTSLTLSPVGTGLSVLTVTTATNNLAGNYTLTVTGTGGSMTRKVTLTLTITSGFTISANPTSLTIISGTSKSSTISLKSLGLKGNITLATSVSAPGLTATISPTTLSFTPGQTHSATLTVTSKTAGSYTVTVTTTSGSISHSLTIPVTVTDFTISASPTSLTLTAGTSSKTTISLASLDGFAGTVKLVDTVSPTGLKATLSTTSVGLTAGGTGSAMITISSTTTTLPGSYTIVVTATSGGLVHTTSILVTLTA